MAQYVRVEQFGEVAVVTVDNPPVNVISTAVAEEVAAAVGTAADTRATSSIVLIGANGTFIAGADIREIARIAAGEQSRLDLYSPLEAIEGTQKPVVAAIGKQALGGGLETALACHYRIIEAGGQVGMPEVKLGLMPGAGGTQRLPRLIGVPEAARLCLSGEPVPAAEALRLGIVDKLVAGDLQAEAVAFARALAGKPLAPTRKKTAREGAVTGAIKSQAAALAVEAIAASARLAFQEGCALEARLFSQCVHSTESKALIYGFFGERAVAKIPGLRKDIVPLPVARAAVVGAGTMGSGIATVFASAGIPVLLKETSAEALERGMAAIGAQYDRAVAKGRLAAEAARKMQSAVTPQLEWDGFDGVDVVVEAVYENLDAKRDVFRHLNRIAKPGAILASNTSSLDLDELARATGRPESVVGMHFFSPANLMRLLEVVRGGATSEQALVTAMALGKRLGKTAVLSRNAPGFIGNRAFAPYLREARLLAEEGASVEQVNVALQDWGMAMGPLAVDDLTGLDVSFQIEEQLHKAGTRKPLMTEALFRAGRLGQKSGGGWSRYDEARRAWPDPGVAALVQQVTAEHGLKRRSIEQDEIVERCVTALINESAQLLGEGVALRPVDVDIVFLKGFGFPPYRGGPLFYADTLGLPVVLEQVRRYGWAAAPLLVSLAESRRSFASMNDSR